MGTGGKTRYHRGRYSGQAIKRNIRCAVFIDERAETGSVVEATLATFIEQEQKESLAAVEIL